MKVEDYRPTPSGALLGRFSLALGNGLTIHDMSLFEKGGRRWVNTPSRKYTKPDGTDGYASIVSVSEEARDRFQLAVLKLIEPLLEAQPPADTGGFDDDLPF